MTSITMSLAHLAFTLSAAELSKPVVQDIPIDSTLTEQVMRIAEQGGREAAIAVLFRTVKSDTLKPAVRLLIGRTLLALHDYRSAARQFEWLVQRYPNNGRYYGWAGVAYGANALRGNPLDRYRDARRAKAALERAFLLAPGDPDLRARLIQFHLEGISLVGSNKQFALKLATEMENTHPLLGAVEVARVQWSMKNETAAIRKLRDAIGHYADSAAPRVLLSQILQAKNDYTGALSVVEPLTFPASIRSHEALYQIGRIGALSGLYLDRAEPAIRALVGGSLAMDEWAFLALANLRLGQILDRKGDVAAATEFFQRAARLDPGDKRIAEAVKHRARHN